MGKRWLRPWLEPNTPTVPEPEVDDMPRLRGTELHQKVPDLQTRTWPPPTLFGLGFVQHFPFQLLGVGISLDAYVTDWMRLYVHYSMGFAVARSSGFSNYADALLGVRILGGPSERTVDVVPDDGSPWWRRRQPRPKPTLKAWLPSYHALFVEGGALTGPIAFETCITDCEPDPSNGTLELDLKQLVLPVAGLRYVYFTDATSKRTKELSRQILIEVFAHAIAKPFNDPGHELWFNGKRVQRDVLGGRFGVEFPFCAMGCAGAELVAGYLPMPGSVLFETSIKKSF